MVGTDIPEVIQRVEPGAEDCLIRNIWNRPLPAQIIHNPFHVQHRDGFHSAITLEEGNVR